MIKLQLAAQAACTEIGVNFREVPADGRFHQLDVECKTNRNGAGRIRLFPDSEGGQVWNHISDETRLFWAKNDQTLTLTEQSNRMHRTKTERELADKEIAVVRKKAADTSRKVWNVAVPPENNGYLKRKGVTQTETLREILLVTLAEEIGYTPRAKGKAFTGKRILIVPVKNQQGITTIEMIDETGLKAGLVDGQKKGCFWATGKLPDTDGIGHTIGIGEGVATMLTYHMATGNTGIAALSCGNLKDVAQYFRSRFPVTKIVIISDIGFGEQQAIEAACSIGATIVKPFLAEGSSGSDINDLHLDNGICAVRLQIEAAELVTQLEQPNDNESPSPEYDVFNGMDDSSRGTTLAETSMALFPKIKTMAALLSTTFADIRWVIYGLLPEGLAILSGPPKIGKSWLVMNLCLATATGGHALGKFKVDPGEVLLLSLEDNERRLKGRLQKCMNV